MEEKQKDSVVAGRAFAFAVDTIKLARSLSKSFENIILVKQIVRSATSIGANIEEALGANSRKEFIHCMNIAKKEARETYYWLRIIKEVNSSVIVSDLLQENKELINMLTKIVKTASINS